MKIAIGADHSAIELKDIIKKYLTEKGYEVSDFGVFTEEPSSYPDIAHDVSKEIQNGNFKQAILICGTGVGMSIAANKHKSIRAVVCSDPFSAKMAKSHNDANVLCFGARVVGFELAKMIVDNFLDSKFEKDRHQKRVDRIIEIENQEF